MVSNAPFRIPDSPRVKRVVVSDGHGSGTEPQGRPPAGRLGRKPSWADAQRPAPEGPKYDAADDWIAEAAEALPKGKCVVVTGDILLAERCLKAGARVLGHKGDEFTPASIGGAIATRAIMADLRAGMDGPTGSAGGGPAPFGKADRSRFLQALNRVMVGLRGR
ncbi:DUF188 domain-containing protein [Porphyrobacter sp. YT40]|nr:DUF188 domain-containing protein [Porphyrobacter sp. YT40]